MLIKKLLLVLKTALVLAAAFRSGVTLPIEEAGVAAIKLKVGVTLPPPCEGVGVAAMTLNVGSSDLIRGAGDSGV